MTVPLQVLFGSITIGARCNPWVWLECFRACAHLCIYVRDLSIECFEEGWIPSMRELLTLLDTSTFPLRKLDIYLSDIWLLVLVGDVWKSFHNVSTVHCSYDDVTIISWFHLIRNSVDYVHFEHNDVHRGPLPFPLAPVIQAFTLPNFKTFVCLPGDEDGNAENEKADKTLTNWLPLHITGAFCSLRMLVMRIQPFQCLIFKDIISQAGLTIESICITWVNCKLLTLKWMFLLMNVWREECRATNAWSFYML